MTVLRDVNATPPQIVFESHLVCIRVHSNISKRKTTNRKFTDCTRRTRKHMSTENSDERFGQMCPGNFFLFPCECDSFSIHSKLIQSLSMERISVVRVQSTIEMYPCLGFLCTSNFSERVYHPRQMLHNSFLRLHLIIGSEYRDACF